MLALLVCPLPNPPSSDPYLYSTVLYCTVLLVHTTNYLCLVSRTGMSHSNLALGFLHGIPLTCSYFCLKCLNLKLQKYIALQIYQVPGCPILLLPSKNFSWASL